MKSLRKRLEEIFLAITFAETGEYEKAREILRKSETATGVNDSSVHSLIPLVLKGH